MDWVRRIAEDRIKEAQNEGLFDNLDGKGKPFEFDDDSMVPEDLRLTFKVLKNSNCLPIEMELRREIFNVQQLINAATDENARNKLRRKLDQLRLDLNVRRR